MHLYFVDGHNLILSTEMLSDLLALEGRRASREEAEELILRWATREGDVQVRLYYDGQAIEGGHPGNRDEGPLSVRFTDPPAEADDRIVFEASRESGAGGMVTVVTGDGGIRNRLRGSSVQFVHVEEYLRRLTAPPAEPRKEGRFTEDEQRALSRELHAHASTGDREAGKGEAEVPEREAAPPAREKGPAVVTRPDKGSRRDAYRKRAEKRAGGEASPRAKSKKKRRGF